MEEAFKARLLADSDIRAKVNTRVDWGDRPQAKGLPAITLETISDPRPQHMAGVQELRSTFVQVDVWSLDKLEARDLRELVIAASLPAGTVGATRFGRSFVENTHSSWEKTDNAIVYRERIDLTVWHAAAA